MSQPRITQLIKCAILLKASIVHRQLVAVIGVRDGDLTTTTQEASNNHRNLMFDVPDFFGDRSNNYYVSSDNDGGNVQQLLTVDDVTNYQMDEMFPNGNETDSNGYPWVIAQKNEPLEGLNNFLKGMRISMEPQIIETNSSNGVLRLTDIRCGSFQVGNLEHAKNKKTVDKFDGSQSTDIVVHMKQMALGCSLKFRFKRKFMLRVSGRAMIRINSSANIVAKLNSTNFVEELPRHGRISECDLEQKIRINLKGSIIGEVADTVVNLMMPIFLRLMENGLCRTLRTSGSDALTDMLVMISDALTPFIGEEYNASNSDPLSAEDNLDMESDYINFVNRVPSQQSDYNDETQTVDAVYPIDEVMDNLWQNISESTTETDSASTDTYSKSAAIEDVPTYKAFTLTENQWSIEVFSFLRNFTMPYLPIPTFLLDLIRPPEVFSVYRNKYINISMTELLLQGSRGVSTHGYNVSGEHTLHWSHDEMSSVISSAKLGLAFLGYEGFLIEQYGVNVTIPPVTVDPVVLGIGWKDLSIAVDFLFAMKNDIRQVENLRGLMTWICTEVPQLKLSRAIVNMSTIRAGVQRLFWPGKGMDSFVNNVISSALSVSESVYTTSATNFIGTKMKDMINDKIFILSAELSREIQNSTMCDSRKLRGIWR